jgi:hypothetical protein
MVIKCDEIYEAAKAYFAECGVPADAQRHYFDVSKVSPLFVFFLFPSLSLSLSLSCSFPVYLCVCLNEYDRERRSSIP